MRVLKNNIYNICITFSQQSWMEGYYLLLLIISKQESNLSGEFRLKLITTFLLKFIAKVL